MAVYVRALLPRVLVVTAVWLVGSGTLTFAADKTLVSNTPAKAPVAAPRPTLTVPDVRSQAFVFAKGILSDGGFAWRVVGSVRGYATNRVVSQKPAPGTVVVDTGAPTILLGLARGSYGQTGTPSDLAPYAGTPIVMARSAKTPAKKPAAGKLPLAPPKVSKAPVKHAAKRTHKSRKHLAARPPAFTVPGGRTEPQKEMSLPARARLLDRWLTSSRHANATNQRHWLYQHAWIVTGARFGWWHGADALRILIRVDRRVESQWGIGRRSESVARAALAAVEARAK
jgi:PASTA domain